MILFGYNIDFLDTRGDSAAFKGSNESWDLRLLHDRKQYRYIVAPWLIRWQNKKKQNF